MGKDSLKIHNSETDSQTERKKKRETERQRDRETERQRDSEKEVTFYWLEVTSLPALGMVDLFIRIIIGCSSSFLFHSEWFERFALIIPRPSRLIIGRISVVLQQIFKIKFRVDAILFRHVWPRKRTDSKKVYVYGFGPSFPRDSLKFQDGPQLSTSTHRVRRFYISRDSRASSSEASRAADTRPHRRHSPAPIHDGSRNPVSIRFMQSATICCKRFAYRRSYRNAFSLQIIIN